MNKNTKIKARIVNIKSLTSIQEQKMYEILQRYYDGITWEQFQKDISEKNIVILLENTVEGICGFSTLLWKPIEIDGKSVIGVFSGDTILKEKYWGSPALGIKFLSFLWLLKLKHLNTPVYWFLISKGYKTYLLMANNFKYSYPNIGIETPDFEKKLMNVFYSDKFKDQYMKEKGLIVFNQGPTCKLKGTTAPITPTLRRTIPRIAFFEKINPNWTSGTELACIAKMTLDMPFRYFFKKTVLKKNYKKSSLKQKNQYAEQH